MQEKMDELQMELDSMRIELEHAQLSAKENEAAARALRYYTVTQLVLITTSSQISS